MSMIGNLIALHPDQLAALIAKPELVEPLLYPEGDEHRSNHLDIDKAWHAIHYTLNGNPWEGEEPLSLTILGGEEIGDDAGYGPARYLNPAQVRAVAQALVSVTPQVFSGNFNPAALDAAEVYPQMWERDGAEGLEYVLQYYNEVSSFYQAAAERGDAALLFLN